MHCPRCGHQQSSDESRFCTKCGLEMTDVKELLAPELRQTKAQRRSKINKAKRQGMAMILSGFVVILTLAILQDFVNIPKFMFAAAVLIFIIGGAIRMTMPSLFGTNELPESEGVGSEKDPELNNLQGENSPEKSLSEAQYHPPMDLGLNIFDTNDLAEPLSVTENTTRHLDKEIHQTKD